MLREPSKRLKLMLNKHFIFYIHKRNCEKYKLSEAKKRHYKSTYCQYHIQRGNTDAYYCYLSPSQFRENEAVCKCFLNI